MTNITITAIKSLQDNYIWFISTPNYKICIDPGDFSSVLDFINKNNYKLDQIWLTHGHFDHTAGVEKLIAIFPTCKVIGPGNIPSVNISVQEGFNFKLEDLLVQVWYSPGHTNDHIIFLVKNTKYLQPIRIFTGDTLFSAGAGRVLGGTIAQLKNSIDRINTLPSDTIIYPAHEYTNSNLKFALFLENENKDIIQSLENINIPSLPVTLEHERKVNPFLRYKNIQIINFIKNRYPQIKTNDYLSVFTAIRQLKNNFKA